jgi:hypothetical protein
MPAHETLSLWESFYVIVGSSAGALTGLQFVVMALIPESEQTAAEHEINTFATPTVVHFCCVLLVSTVLSAPWPQLFWAAVTLWVIGVGGIIYTSIVIRRARRATLYKPVPEDWLWYCFFPLFGYLLLLAASAFIVSSPTSGLFGIGAAALILLFIGIHNAWDSATFIALAGQHAVRSADNAPAPPGS